MSIKIAIVEDQQKIIDRLIQRLSFFDDIEILFTASGDKQAMEYLEKFSPADLPKVILMDIEMSMKGAHKYFSQNKNMLGLKGALVLLSSQLLIRDLYKYTLSKIENYKRLRNLINKGDKAFDIKKDSLYKLTKKYDSRKLKKSISKGFSIYEKAGVMSI